MHKKYHSFTKYQCEVTGSYRTAVFLPLGECQDGSSTPFSIISVYILSCHHPSFFLTAYCHNQDYPTQVSRQTYCFFPLDVCVRYCHFCDHRSHSTRRREFCIGRTEEVCIILEHWIMLQNNAKRECECIPMIIWRSTFCMFPQIKVYLNYLVYGAVGFGFAW